MSAPPPTWSPQAPSQGHGEQYPGQYTYAPGQYPPAPGQYPPAQGYPPTSAQYYAPDQAYAQPDYSKPGAYPPAGAPQTFYSAPPPAAYQAPHQAVNIEQPNPPARKPSKEPIFHALGGDANAAIAAQFAEKSMRNGFVKKVFGIVSLQLLFTVGFTAMCMFVQPVKQYMQANYWLLTVSSLLTLVLVLALGCNENLRRKHPINMIMLGLITLTQSVLVGSVTSRYDVSAVLLAFGCTCGAVILVTLVASTNKFDITHWGMYLFVAGVIILIAGIVSIFWRNPVFQLVLAALCALISVAYLLFTMQLLFGGKSHELSPDEYILAALNIYIDIINIFLSILAIIGLSGRV